MCFKVLDVVKASIILLYLQQCFLWACCSLRCNASFTLLLFCRLQHLWRQQQQQQRVEWPSSRPTGFTRTWRPPAGQVRLRQTLRFTPRRLSGRRKTHGKKQQSEMFLHKEPRRQRWLCLWVLGFKAQIWGWQLIRREHWQLIQKGRCMKSNMVGDSVAYWNKSKSKI